MPSLDLVSLAVDLMSVDSTSGREGEVVALAERRLTERGWTVQRIPVSEGRDALLAQVDEAPLVTLSTHLDTVPPFVPPRVEGGRLWGRGACDAKGIAAAMCVAAERLRADAIPVALLFVVGEETTHDGARAANGVPTTSRVLLDGEPTESILAVGTKGVLKVTVRTTGRAAHSAYPHLGDSAIDRLVRLLARLPELQLPADPLLGDTTVNVGHVSGGVADNVVAPWAEARLMVRLVGDADAVMARLRAWAGDDAELEPSLVVPPVRLSTVSDFPTGVVAYATDVPELSAWGEPYLFGPGSIHVAHTPHEHVEIAELVAAVDAYDVLARRALAQQSLAE
ncbi:MAG TPA: M20/M25/M40 family metallo-hydrolase [Gemmatimonadaceae bacterium]|nr:M20/M25/M40 family metallo-hydrolase [Gemmatimonadaceae bacterium]